MEHYDVVTLTPAEQKALVGDLALDQVGNLHPSERDGNDGSTQCITVWSNGTRKRDCIWGSVIDDDYVTKPQLAAHAAGDSEDLEAPHDLHVAAREKLGARTDRRGRDALRGMELRRRATADVAERLATSPRGGSSAGEERSRATRTVMDLHGPRQRAARINLRSFGMTERGCEQPSGRRWLPLLHELPNGTATAAGVVFPMSRVRATVALLAALGATSLVAGVGRRPARRRREPSKSSARGSRACSSEPRAWRRAGAGRGRSAVWAGGVGLADRERGAVTADTLFRVGSITKSFVALALVKLADEGRIDVDARVSDRARARHRERWADASPITVAHVLEHTAGFDDMHFNEVFAPVASRACRSPRSSRATRARASRAGRRARASPTPTRATRSPPI